MPVIQIHFCIYQSKGWYTFGFGTTKVLGILPPPVFHSQVELDGGCRCYSYFVTI